MHITSLIIIITVISLQGADLVAFTEILKDPRGNENTCPGGLSHEFIELINLGGDTFFIDDIFICDGKTVDSLIPWSSVIPQHTQCIYSQAYLCPGECAVILDRDYMLKDHSFFYLIEDSTVILTVDASSIAGGLTENKGVFLYRGTRTSIRDSLAAILDPEQQIGFGFQLVHTPASGIPEGISIVPAQLLFPQIFFSQCTDTISPGKYEYASNQWICDYKLADITQESILCSLGVLMIGKEKSVSALWNITNQNTGHTVASGNISNDDYPVFFGVLLPKDSVSYLFTVTEYGKSGSKEIIISNLWIPHTTVKINELFPRSHGQTPEWIELVNTASMPINLKNWRISNSEITDTIIKTDCIMYPGHFLILARSTPLFQQQYPIECHTIQPITWPTLNNYHDTVCLYTPFSATPVEAVCYESAWFEQWEYQALQRISIDKEGTDRAAWTLAQRPSPGQPNPGIIWHSQPPSLHIGPIPFTPNADGKNDWLNIQISSPPGYKVSIEIFAFNGRKIFDVPLQLENKYLWNGKTNTGSDAPIGPFFVIATFQKGNTRKIIRKKSILWR